MLAPVPVTMVLVVFLWAFDGVQVMMPPELMVMPAGGLIRV